jgi:hypothetical protein
VQMALSGRDRADAFLRCAHSQADGTEAHYKLFGDGGTPGITGIWYRDRPWPGWGLGFTYGASVLQDSAIELLIVVRSLDPVWVWALADFVDRHRQSIGQLGIEDTLDWHEPIVRQCHMDAFLIGPPVSLPAGEGIVHLSPVDRVQLLQAIPVHASELPLIRQVGGKAFAAQLGDDLLNPDRPPVC